MDTSIFDRIRSQRMKLCIPAHQIVQSFARKYHDSRKNKNDKMLGAVHINHGAWNSSDLGPDQTKNSEILSGNRIQPDSEPERFDECLSLIMILVLIQGLICAHL